MTEAQILTDRAGLILLTNIMNQQFPNMKIKSGRLPLKQNLSLETFTLWWILTSTRPFQEGQIASMLIVEVTQLKQEKAMVV